MKKKFLVFRDERGGSIDGGQLPKQENELQEGGAGAAETSGHNAQVAGSQGEEAQEEGEDYTGQTNIQPGSTPQGTTTED
jgi:hypothetical protein